MSVRLTPHLTHTHPHTDTPVHPHTLTHTPTPRRADEKGRPTYTDDSMKALLDGSGLADAARAAASAAAARSVSVVDVGSGTGKFTAALLRALDAELGPAAAATVKLTCVEPSELAANLTATFGDRVSVVRSVADRLPLPDSSAQTVFVAQAFHWFATRSVVTELARVLVPGGGLALVWNLRVLTEPWMVRLEDVLLRYYAKDPSVPRVQTGEWKRAFEVDPLPCLTPQQYQKFPWAHECTHDDLVAMVMSISVVGRQSEEEKAAVRAEVRDMLAELPPSMVPDGPPGRVRVPYIAHVYTCQKKAAGK